MAKLVKRTYRRKAVFRRKNFTKKFPIKNRRGVYAGRRNKKSSTEYVSGSQPFKDTLLVGSRWCYTKSATCVAYGSATFGVATLNSIRINDAYDPLLGVGTVSIKGWNNLAQIYSRYVVDSATVRVQYSQPTQVGMYAVVSACQDVDLTNYPIDQISTYPHSFVKPIALYNQAYSITRKYKMWQLLDIPAKEFYANQCQDYASNMDASPTYPIFFRYGLLAGGTCPAGTQYCDVRVFVTMRIRLFRIRNIGIDPEAFDTVYVEHDITPSPSISSETKATRLAAPRRKI